VCVCVAEWPGSVVWRLFVRLAAALRSCLHTRCVHTRTYTYTLTRTRTHTHILCTIQVPPYSRAGLYKELLSLKELIFEYRESPASNAPLRPTIAAQVLRAG
jgi:hypothetical protein